MQRVAVLISFAIAGQLHAETLLCPDRLVSVVDAGPLAPHVCAAASRAIAELRVCSLPMDRKLSVTVRDSMEADCVGSYHCGSDRIEILSPKALDARRTETGMFAALETLAWFDSVLFHELVHAAADPLPCPFESCVATAEYLAYALQIRALSSQDRETMGLPADDVGRVSRDAINPMILFWAPDRFASKAWVHLMQQPDPCAYVATVASGQIRFDSGSR